MKMTPKEYFDFYNSMITIAAKWFSRDCDADCDDHECPACSAMSEFGASMLPPEGYFNEEEQEAFENLRHEELVRCYEEVINLLEQLEDKP